MSIRDVLRTACAALFVFTMTVRADDSKPAADAPKTTTGTPHVRGLVKLYNELKDLTADQTTKLKEIHAKALAGKKEIEAKEKEDCVAVLTDDQKKELTEVTAKSAADRKTANASKKKDAAASSTESK